MPILSIWRNSNVWTAKSLALSQQSEEGSQTRFRTGRAAEHECRGSVRYVYEQNLSRGAIFSSWVICCWEPFDNKYLSLSVQPQETFGLKSAPLPPAVALLSSQIKKKQVSPSQSSGVRSGRIRRTHDACIETRIESTISNMPTPMDVPSVLTPRFVIDCPSRER